MKKTDLNTLSTQLVEKEKVLEQDRLIEKEKATKQAEMYFQILSEKYQFKEEYIHIIIKNIIQSQEKAKQYDVYREWAIKATIGFLVIAFFAGLEWVFLKFMDSVFEESLN